MDLSLNEAISLLVNDVFGIVLTLAFLMLSMLTAELWRYFLKPKVEWTRKFVHFCSGLVICLFPWLIKSVISVLVIAALMMIVLHFSKRLGLLQSVHGVTRKSEGDAYYLLAVVLIFLISKDKPAYFVAAILTLAVADALAALIGSAYHKIAFSVEANQKSLEGSTVFFLATFLTTHLPLLFLSDLSREMTVLIGLQVAIVVTLIEAIAIRGIDNLAIPLSVYFLLIKLEDKTETFLISQMFVQVLLIAAVLLFCLRFRFFSLSAGIVNHLFLFAAFALCGPSWLLPPVLAMIVFARFRKKSDQQNPLRLLPNYQLMSAAYVCFVPVAIIFINNFLTTFFKIRGHLVDDELFFGLYTGAVSASASLSLVTPRRVFKKESKDLLKQSRVLLCTSFIAFIAIVPASLVLAGYGGSVPHWGASFSFAFFAPLFHFIFWYRSVEHSMSYLAFSALCLTICMIVSSTFLIAFSMNG